MRVLVIEDEPDLARGLVQALREGGYAADMASDGVEGLRKATSCEYEAVVLDLMLPGLGGLEVLRRLRTQRKTPVLILTARDGVGDRVAGLDAGADDYLVKPFALSELLARLRAVIRRSVGLAQTVIRIGDIAIDTAMRTVSRGAEPVPLTAREYALLELLAHYRGKLITRTVIYDRLFGDDDDSLSNVVEVHVSHLRKKLGKDLQAWHALILLLVVAGFGALLYLQARRSTLDEIDADLLAGARVLEGVLRTHPRTGPGPPIRPREAGTVDNRLPAPPFPPGRRPPVEGGAAFPPAPPPFPPRNGGEPPGQEPPLALSLPASFVKRYAEEGRSPYFAIRLADGSLLGTTPGLPEVPIDEQVGPGRESHVRQRGPQRELTLLGPGRSRILVGRPIAKELANLHQLGFRLAVSGLAVFALGLVGGGWLSARAVRPIRTMSQTVAGMTADRLSERIDLASVDAELGQLGSLVNEMFDRLQTAFEQQTRFTADASHELRTPLSVILTHTELALSRPRTSQEYREALETCERAARRMKSLVDDLLTLARADSAKLAVDLEREPIDLGRVASESARMLEAFADQHGVRLEVSPGPAWVTGEPARIAQLATNLITNAILYNRAGGRVTVSTEAAGSEVVLTVADTGIGIPELDLPLVFERFHRVDRARSRAQGGSGLGLAICQSIVQAHCGRIAIESQPDVGTTVTVRLPTAVGHDPVGHESDPIPAHTVTGKP